MSTLKCTAIIIIVAAYLQKCVYAQPPEDDNIRLSDEAVECINELTAYFKVPSPYPWGREALYDELLLVSSDIDYRFSKYLHPKDINYKAEVNLTKLMLVKGAITHLRSPSSNSDYTIFTFTGDRKIDYYNMLGSELQADIILTPWQFCQSTNTFLMTFLSLLNINFMQSTCMEELEGFPQDSTDIALAHAYLTVTYSDFKDSEYGKAYMKHIIKNAKVMEYIPAHNNLKQPVAFCIEVTESSSSSRIN